MILKAKRIQLQSSWSPDGKWLAYTQLNQHGKSEIWAVRVNGDQNPIPLVRDAFDNDQPAISPNGDWLAYASDESGRTEIYVRPFPDVEKSKTPVSVEGGFEPVWSPDGSELFYRWDDIICSALIKYQPETKIVQRIPLFQADFRRSLSPNYDIHPTEDYFVIATVTDTKRQLIVKLNYFKELERMVSAD